MTWRPVITWVIIVALLVFSKATGAKWDAAVESNFDALVAQEAYTEVLKRLQTLPADDDRAVVVWIARHADAGRLIAPFLIERSKRAFRHDPKEGLKWFYAGLLWGNYDARRCQDKTAAQAILVFQTLVPEVVARQKEYPWEAKDAAVDAVSWEEGHPALASPWWICAHGIKSAIDVNKADPGTWLKPEQQWPALRKEARQWLRAVIVELSKEAAKLDYLVGIDPATLAARPASGKMRTEGGYAMWDSGLLASHDAPKWIDDDQLVIKAFDGPVPRTHLEYRRLERGEYSRLSMEEFKRRRAAEPDLKLFEHYVWQPGSQPKQISDDRWTGVLIRGNEIEVFLRCPHPEGNCSKREAFRLRGRPGLFKEFLYRAPGDQQGYHPTTYHSTHFEFHTVLDPAMRGMDWTLLKKGHGKIVWGPVDPAKMYKYGQFFPEGAKVPIELPFGLRDIGLPLWGRWVEFKGAYLFGIGLVSNEPFNAKWRESNCRTVWWMWPSGRAENECIPAGPWVQLGGIWIYPSVKGWVLTAWRDDQPRSGAVNSMYLINAGRHEIVLHGAIAEGDISPNGCRVAFLYAPFGSIGVPVRLNRRETFRIIDLCDKEERRG